MTKETYEGLSKYESYLTTAAKANYIRSLTNSQMDELIVLAAEVGIHHVNNHCPKCALEFIKRLAAPYFEYKQLMEETKDEGKTAEKPKRNSKKASDNRGDSEG